MEWYIFIEFGVLVAFLVYWAISSTRMENRIDELENENRTWKRIHKIERKRIHTKSKGNISSASIESEKSILLKMWQRSL